MNPPRASFSVLDDGFVGIVTRKVDEFSCICLFNHGDCQVVHGSCNGAVEVFVCDLSPKALCLSSEICPFSHGRVYGEKVIRHNTDISSIFNNSDTLNGHFNGRCILCVLFPSLLWLLVCFALFAFLSFRLSGNFSRSSRYLRGLVILRLFRQQVSRIY